MFSVQTVQSNEVAVLQCRGRLVRSDAAYRLRDAVTAHASSRVIVLDFSQLEAVEGGGLGMLVFLQRWAQDIGIKLQLFNPSPAVCENLNRAAVAAVSGLRIISEEEFLRRLGCYETQVTPPIYLAA
jgi:anti-anti-sigma regulatory factor